jgi:hypothetical protein
MPPKWWYRSEYYWEHRLVDVICALNDVRNGKKARLWRKRISVDRVLEAIISLCSSWLKMREWRRRLDDDK